VEATSVLGRKQNVELVVHIVCISIHRAVCFLYVIGVLGFLFDSGFMIAEQDI